MKIINKIKVIKKKLSSKDLELTLLKKYNGFYSLRFVNKKEKEIVKKSAYFDENWYLHQYKDSYTDAAADYVLRFKRRNPSVNFITRDYFKLNGDVKRSGMNPLVHFEKFGKIENRKMRLVAKDTEYVQNLTKLSESFIGFNDKRLHPYTKSETVHNKVLVFASYCPDNELHDFRIKLLKEVRKYCDYLVFVSDNEMPEDVLRKADYIDAYYCRKHNGFDFGSYCIGIKILKKLNFLNNDSDLILMNDSCFGPVCSFEPVFSKYDKLKSEIDFYGLSESNDYKRHVFIQSFFYIFSENVYKSLTFKKFFKYENIVENLLFNDLGVNYESELTFKLSNAGFYYKTYLDQADFTSKYGNCRPTNKPLELITFYKYPLIKRKFLVLNYKSDYCQNLLCYLRENCKEFYESFDQYIEGLVNKSGSIQRNRDYLPINYSYGAVREHYKSILPKIKDRVRKNSYIKVLFLVVNLSMFSGRSLIKKMMSDPRFKIEIWVIPDIRFRHEDNLKEYRKCLKNLRKDFSDNLVFSSVKNIDSKYPIYKDIFASDPDVVFYPTPYECSETPYNIPNIIRYCSLPAYINYGFPRNKYCQEVFKRYNYSNFWKIFLETDFQFNDYKNNGYVNADNAVVVGYSKIDELYDFLNNISNEKSHVYKNKKYKKIIIIAPHHSLARGYNESMQLSNFLKYSGFFLRLPNMFPDVLFVFRPHPALFPLLRNDNFWGVQKTERYIRQLNSYENVVYSVEGDYYNWFAVSDAMIHDCGSFTVEYLYTNKPCCYLLKKYNEINKLFNQFGIECLDCYEHAYRESDILAFINKILNNIDSKYQIRNKFFRKYLEKNFSKASDNIINYLLKQLY